MAAQIGLDCKVYRLSTGDRASWDGSSDTVVTGSAPADLDECTRVREVTIPFDKTEADASDRSCKFKKILTGLIDVGVTISMVYDKTDTDYEAFRDAFFASSMIALAILDGASDTVGTEGLWADFEVLNMQRAEPLEDTVTLEFTLKPSGASSIDPQWVTIST